jgi:hypothetical protein
MRNTKTGNNTGTKYDGYTFPAAAPDFERLPSGEFESFIMRADTSESASRIMLSNYALIAEAFSLCS